MWNIRRFFNQNRKGILIFLLVVFFLFLVLQIINYFVGKDYNERTNANIRTNNTIYNSTSNTIIKSNKSVITGENIDENKLNKDNEIIEKFFDFCNTGDYEKAYNMLTDECKEEMYPSIQNFIQSYCNSIIDNGGKKVSAENWTGNIYKVKIVDDYLSSGNYTSQNSKQDYISILKKDGEYKLNINGYIGRNNFNKESEEKGINIKVLEENKYMDYVEYTFEITNNSNKSILLDTLTNIDSMFLQDKNDVKYSAYTHNLNKSQLVIGEGEKKQLKLKYYSNYSSNKRIQKIVFSKVVLDYEEFDNLHKFEINL